MGDFDVFLVGVLPLKCVKFPPWQTRTNFISKLLHVLGSRNDETTHI